jgi:proteasome accessory factor C
MANRATSYNFKDRLARVLAMVIWLSKVKECTIEELSQRFKSTQDIIMRDLSLLSLCGLPPYSPDELIEIQFEDNWVSANYLRGLDRVVYLTRDEILVLVLKLKVLHSLSEPEEAECYGKLIEKLMKTLGLNSADFSFNVPRPAYLGLIEQALKQSKSVEILYNSVSEDRETKQRIFPLELDVRSQKWYLNAYSFAVSNRRRYRVDRIISAELRDISAAELKQVQDSDPLSSLSADARGVELICDQRDLWAFESIDHEVIETDSKGFVKLRIWCYGVSWLQNVLLRLKYPVEILKPAEWKNAVKQSAKKILELYC